MRKLKVSKIWIPAFLLAVLIAGCGDSDRSTGSATSPLTPPTVTSVTPPTGSAVVCPNTPVITATFSKAMNPLTINTATFTLAGPSGASVSGTVSLDSAGLVATFTPLTPPGLATRTTYTATITTGAADTFGNTLAANFPWTFTTSPFNPCPPPVAAVALGAACGYGVLAHSTVTNTGATTIRGVPPATADLGLSPGAAVTGFAIAPANTFVGSGTNTAGLGIVTGTIHLTDPPPAASNTAAQAQADLTVAYNDLAGRTAPAPTILTGAAPDLGGLTLAPGIYKSNTSVGITGTVTLDGGGDPNAVWIFQISSTFITASNSNVVLAGSASAHNIFWQVGSSATLGTSSHLEGSIVALASVTLNTGATLNGRALASTAAVTLDTNMVTIPSCP